MNREHCFAPQIVVTQLGFALFFGGVSAHPFSVEVIPPLIKVFCLTKVCLEQAVLTANTPAFLHYQSPGKNAHVFMYS